MRGKLYMAADTKKILTAEQEQELRAPIDSYVGGILGMVSSGSVSVGHAIVQADLTARNILGGVIGEVSASATAGLGSVTVSEAAVKEGVLRVEGQNSAPFVGGIIGRLSSNETSSAAVSISNSYDSKCWRNRRRHRIKQLDTEHDLLDHALQHQRPRQLLSRNGSAGCEANRY